MARREQKIRKSCGAAHLPQVPVTVGRGSAHIIGNQITGQRNIAGLRLVVAGIVGFKINGPERAVGGSLPHQPVGAVRQLLAGPQIEAVGAQGRIHQLRVKAAVAVRGPHKDGIHLVRLIVVLLEHDAGIGMQIIHQKKIENHIEHHCEQREQHNQARFAQRARNPFCTFGIGHRKSFIVR